jgi:hypothetical protein
LPDREVRFIRNEVVYCCPAWRKACLYAREVGKVMPSETVDARFLVLQVAERTRHADTTDTRDTRSVVDFAAGVFDPLLFRGNVRGMFDAQHFDVPAICSGRA